PIKGLAEAKPLDNASALALNEIPKRLIVIGGGAIGMELGTFYAEVGSKVTVLEMLPQPIGYADPELIRLLVRSLATKGVEVKVDVILGEDSKMDYDVLPNVVYTHPEVATVGLTEAQAKEKYPDAKSSRFSFKASGRALALGESEGLMKLVTAGPHGRILGAHIVGPQASELIAEATLAMRLEASVEDVIATVHAHPPLAETFREAAPVS